MFIRCTPKGAIVSWVRVPPGRSLVDPVGGWGRIPATDNGTIPRFAAGIGPRDKPGDDEQEGPPRESKFTTAALVPPALSLDPWSTALPQGDRIWRISDNFRHGRA